MKPSMEHAVEVWWAGGRNRKLESSQMKMCWRLLGASTVAGVAVQGDLG